MAKYREITGNEDVDKLVFGKFDQFERKLDQVRGETEADIKLFLETSLRGIVGYIVEQGAIVGVSVDEGGRFHLDEKGSSEEAEARLQELRSKVQKQMQKILEKVAVETKPVSPPESATPPSSPSTQETRPISPVTYREISEGNLDQYKKNKKLKKFIELHKALEQESNGILDLKKSNHISHIENLFNLAEPLESEVIFSQDSEKINEIKKFVEGVLVRYEKVMANAVAHIGEKEPVTPEKTDKGESLPVPEGGEAKWTEWTLEMIAAGNYEALTARVKELFLERIQTTQESKKDSRYEEYVGIKKGLVAKQKIGEDIPDGLKFAFEKANEMDQLRTVMDYCFKYGNSDSMTSDWAGLGTEYSTNGLRLRHFDYFTGRGPKSEMGRYRYADHIKTLLQNLFFELKDTDYLRDYHDGPESRKKVEDFLKGKISKLKNTEGGSLNKYEQDEIYGLVDQIAVGLGIRLTTFVDQHAMGATPSGGVARNSKWLDVLPFVVHRYKTYKDRLFNPMTEVFRAPLGWEGKQKKLKHVKDRLNSINFSNSDTIEEIELFAPLREPCPMGIPDKDRNRNRDGDELASLYPTLFEFMILDDRRDKKQDLTGPGYLSGHQSVVEFVQGILEIPGGTIEVKGKNSKELRESLVDGLGKLLNSLISNLKKNQSFVDWNQVGHLVLLYIDKMHRVYGLNDNSLSGHVSLTDEIRKKLITGVTNMAGLGDSKEKDTFYGVDSKEPLAFDKVKEAVPKGDGKYGEKVVKRFDKIEAKEKIEKELRKKPTSEFRNDPEGTIKKELQKEINKVYDLRDFILNRIPQAKTLIRGIALGPTISISNLRSKEQGASKRRSHPTVKYQKLLNLKHSYDEWKKKFSGVSLRSFEFSKIFAYGMPKTDQQSRPDEEAKAA